MFAAACLRFGAPAGPPRGTYHERLSTLARLIRMEDRRRYDPLLTGRAAASPDSWLRAKTALAAGRLGDPEASPFFPVLLRDPEPSVRRAAAFGAGLSGDGRLIRFLVRALDDSDVETSARAAEALGKLGGEEAVAALLARLGGAGPARAASALALFRFSEPQTVAALLGLAQEREPELRRAVIYALARKPARGAAPALRGALADSDPEVVAFSARALGLLGDAPAASALTGLIRSPSASVAIQSLVALDKIGEKQALGHDARAAALERSRDPHPGVAVASLRLLGRFSGENDARARLEQEVGRGGWRGQTALVSLARLLGAESPALLMRTAGSASLELKLGAAETLAFLPEEGALPLAERLLSDPSARVRAAALGLLPKEIAAKHAGLLERALADPDPAVRAAALEAAAPLVDDGAAVLERAWKKAYERSFSQDEPDFTVGALEAAGARGDAGKELILARMNDRDAVVRRKARALLVSRYGIDPRGMTPMAVGGRLTWTDYQRLAREANETVLTATVETARGSFSIALDAEEAPMTVDSFRSLAQRSFFDGLLVHRVVPDFVIQTGDPRGDGSGGPGYALRDEINPARYVRGTVGMALSGADTGGSQWFVTLSAQPHLDGGYTVFGSVTDGMEVVDRLEQDDRVLSVHVASRPRLSPPPRFLAP